MWDGREEADPVIERGTNLKPERPPENSRSLAVLRGNDAVPNQRPQAACRQTTVYHRIVYAVYGERRCVHQ